MAGNTAAAAPLSFAHALTAVRFTTGDDLSLIHISLLVLLGFGGIDSRSNPYVLRSGATYLEARVRISVSDSDTLFALLGRCRESYLFALSLIHI